MFDWNRKTVGVTGASGMIGRYVVDMLINAGATPIALDIIEPQPGIDYRRTDLRNLEDARKNLANLDVVICAAGIKGSPDACLTRPADFFVPMSQLNLNTLQACQEHQIQHVVYMSSIGVYGPASLFKEEETWRAMPSPNDWFGGWAKRIGELQIEAYQKQGTKTHFHTIRPANVYGRCDNFMPPGAMVVPSLIRKAFESNDGYLDVIGDGSPRRDFIYAADVARAAMFVVERGIEVPVNVGSGIGISIGTLAQMIINLVNPNLRIRYSSSPMGGDNVRIMDMSRMKNAGFKEKWTLEAGLSETCDWFLENHTKLKNRFNPFAI